MGQKKLIRFEAIKSFPNVLQYPEGMAGQWSAFFKNNHPLTLELACGKGEYTVGLAQMYPQRNFLGVDMKGNRIYIGAKKCLEEKIINAAFLRTHIDKLPSYFNKDEVSEIWLTFPDPQLRKSRATRRLTHPKFIRIYQQILVPGGNIHLKTDSPVLYQFTKWVVDMYGLTLLEDIDDIHAGPIKEELAIQTHYESLDIAQSKRVHYLRFTLPVRPLPDLDAQLLERIKNEEPVPPARVRPPRIHEKAPRPPASSRERLNAVKPSGGKDDSFFDLVHEVARQIPRGRVTSYGAIAACLGTRLSARMVGWAMMAVPYAKKPVPAHRVVNRNGLLTGKHHYSPPERMQQLLEKEGVVVKDDKVVDFKKLFWDTAQEL